MTINIKNEADAFMAVSLFAHLLAAVDEFRCLDTEGDKPIDTETAGLKAAYEAAIKIREDGKYPSFLIVV